MAFSFQVESLRMGSRKPWHRNVLLGCRPREGRSSCNYQFIAVISGVKGCSFAQILRRVLSPFPGQRVSFLPYKITVLLPLPDEPSS
jgi:hypothetical protein